MSEMPQAMVFDRPETWASLAWQPFREGVEVAWLYRSEEDGGPASALLRYRPGASVPRHRHVGWEHIVVLSGSQADETATYTAGAAVVNPPGSEHGIVSEEGCVALLIWEKTPQFV